MSEIRSVEIQEFQANLQKYEGLPRQPVAITSNGQPVGYFIPAQKSLGKDQLETLKKSQHELTKMLEDSEVTEDEIVAEFSALRKKKHTEV